MNKQQKTIELLAPAKDKEIGITAVNCGADAVYIGADRYGARAMAGNTLKDIEDLVKYAHIYRSKVYVTVNTVLRESEMEEAYPLIRRLHNMGIDGLIIQDMGILELELPPVKLIASTQTHNTTPEKVKFLEDVGFQRVILARELNLEEIRKIREKTNVELESFVHGALCVSYSGQCYMSWSMGRRSGNRGVCAQPCRKAYSLIDSKGLLLEKNKHLLSLKDLNLSDYLEELIDAGITSFKIEGRLKEESYVKNITAFYRQKLDDILEKRNLNRASVGKVIFDFTPNPIKTFNRDYTSHFIEGRQKAISRMETPKFRGEFIGVVTGKQKNTIFIDTGKSLTAGDGICFLKGDNTFSGTYVNRVDKNVIKVQDDRDIETGTKIYRNLDKQFMDELKKSKTRREIAVSFSLDESDDSTVLTVRDEEGISVSIPWVITGEKANNKEHYEEIIRKNLSKLGNTEFYAEEVTVTAKNPDFCSIKEINAMRRDIIAKLFHAREKAYKPDEFPYEPNTVPYPETSLSFRSNVLNRNACNFYIHHGAKVMESGAESGMDLTGRIVMKNRYCLKYELNLCPVHDGKPATPIKEPLFLVDEDKNRFRLEFDCKNCFMEIRKMD